MYHEMRANRTAPCPHCGCEDCTIIRPPTHGSWFQQHGRARCNACGTQFTITTVPASVPPPISHQEAPPVNGHRQQEEQTIVVRYQVYCCEDCGERLKVTSTKGTVRFLKCRACGATFKLAAEEKIILRK